MKTLEGLYHALFMDDETEDVENVVNKFSGADDLESRNNMM
jgi:hypothetical protein